MPIDSKQRTYQYIDQPHKLATLCHDLLCQEVEWFAIDTEFVRVDTYFPELSLVQLATEDKAFYLIDPLAIKESAPTAGSTNPLQPLIDLLANPAICKVFHSARQDIEVLFQLQNVMLQNIFDTQFAALFLGYGDMAGFARVIEGQLGIRLEKSQTRTNWHARPLSLEQIDYALDDVDYLVDLYQVCIEKLHLPQLNALQEDNESLLQAELYCTEPQNAWLKLKGLNRLKPKQLAIVQQLAQWRENYAIANNLPKKWSLSDEVILDIAKRPPQTVQALYKVPNIKASSVREFGDCWIALIDQVFAMPMDTYPQLPIAITAPTPEEESLLLIAQAICQQKAREYHLQINHLANKDDLLILIRQPLQSNLIGWRQLILGQPLQAWLKGNSAVQYTQGKLSFYSI
ncbi:ribonuclease D [Thiosulfatimonas sediminis]|uniref:Ribonuclease D n=1 Tax=Thiosulfatimonas sediminis TaxID=2675054 RepID=A0A6F8PUE2_9GAMM|nr:ribonuclease D [Thiosulfatimonas sediminis]BBP45647.1 ribonuclease D [Thiosulfatimonas sediminis]